MVNIKRGVMASSHPNDDDSSNEDSTEDYTPPQLLDLFGEKLHRNGAVKEVKSYRKKATAIVIFLHGSGGTGVEMREYLKMFKKDLDIISGVRHIRFMFPSAPVKPYTALYGQKSRVWHDRQGIHMDLPEMKESIDEQAKDLKVFIDNLVKDGTPINRIAIGGFSMGGSMALHMVYRYYPQMAGCFTLSSFLHKDSMVYENLANITNKETLPPLIAFHGDWDPIVPYEWGQEMFRRLQGLGVKGQFHLIKNTTHEIRHTEVDLLYDWYNKVLPKLKTTQLTPGEKKL